MSCISCNCGKRYQRLVCPPRGKATVDYILEWIEDASKLLEAYGTDLVQMEEMKQTLIELGVNELPNVIKDVEALKLIISPTGEVDLTTLMLVLNLFQHDEDYNITAATFPLIEEEELEDTDVMVWAKEDGTLKKGIPFTGKTTDYFAGDGTWQALPDIPDFYEDITYDELYARKEKGELIPGNWYRITDYNTYILSPIAVSAEHPYMVLVRAVSEEVLHEDAIAVRCDKDAYFTPNSHLNAWRIKYCIENDTSRFAYVNDYKPILVLDNQDHSLFLRDEANDKLTPDSVRIAMRALNPEYYAYNPDAIGEKMYAWVKIDIDNLASVIEKIQREHTIQTRGEWVYTAELEPTKDSTLWDSNFNPIRATNPLRLYKKSKGIVYWMQDNRMNEAWYDFKNVKYLRDLGELYTFTTKYEDEFIDLTEVTDLPIHNNKLYPLYVNWEANNGQQYQRLALNDCYIVGSEVFNNMYGPNIQGFYIETFGRVANNSWIGSSGNTTISKGSYSDSRYLDGYPIVIEGNTFGSEFSNNIFEGYNLIDNVFGKGFKGNLFSTPENMRLLKNTKLPIIAENNFGDDITANTVSMGVIEKSSIKSGFFANTIDGVLATQREDGQDYPNVLLTDEGHIISGAEIGYNVTKNTFKSFTRCIIGNDSTNNYFGVGNADTNFGFCLVDCIFNEGVRKTIFDGNIRSIISQGRITGCFFEQGTECIEFISNGDYNNLNISASVSGLPTNYRKLDNAAYIPHAGKRIYVITGAEIEIQAPPLEQHPSTY